MEASIRLYARLGLITEGPIDPDSLDDLTVYAFGAFEDSTCAGGEKAASANRASAKMMRQ